MTTKSKKFLEEAEKDLKIDKLSLDQDCIDQPEIYLKWSERLNEADEVLNKVRNQLTRYKAETYLKVKQDAEARLTKITEAQASAAYRIKGKYKQLKGCEERAEKTRLTLASIVNACIQRRCMLETLCKLHGQDYFHGG